MQTSVQEEALSGRRERIKVLHLITRSILAGAQDNTFLTAERHDRSRYEVHVACNPDGVLFGRAQRVSERCFALPNMVREVSPMKDLRVLFELTQLMRRERYGVVHTHTAKAGFIGRIAARLSGIPVVVHTYHAFPFDDDFPFWKRALYLQMERWARPLADHIITLSERHREEGARFGMIDLRRSSSIYTGIDLMRLRPTRTREEVRSELGVPSGWQVVIQVGRLDAQKAPLKMVEAFAQVVSKMPETMLWMVGEGKLRTRVEAQVRALNLQQRVQLLGLRHDVPDLLNAADVFAFSSLFEAMGRSMVEAMLIGCPVVVPEIGGIPEVVQHRETGLLYPRGVTARLAREIIYLLQNPGEQDRLTRNARRQVRALFDGDAMVRSIEACYEQLLSQKSFARP